MKESFHRDENTTEYEKTYINVKSVLIVVFPNRYRGVGGVT